VLIRRGRSRDKPSVPTIEVDEHPASIQKQFSDEAVDSADEASCWPACVTSLVASLTEASSGTSLTADSKLSQALSSSPVGAFCAS